MTFMILLYIFLKNYSEVSNKSGGWYKRGGLRDRSNKRGRKFYGFYHIF